MDWAKAKDVQEYMAQADQHCFNQAIFDLQNMFKKMYGKEIPVKLVKDTSEVRFPAVILGSLAAEAPFGGTLKDETAKSKYGEGFRVFTKDKAVCILGSGRYGNAYGIYELLNRMGVDFLFPGELGEVIPSNQNLAIPDIQTEQIPSFVIRKPWATGWIKAKKNEGRDIAVWQIRNRIQVYRNLTIEYAAGGHVWDKFRDKKYNKYYEQHPDIASLQILPDGTTK